MGALRSQKTVVLALLQGGVNAVKRFGGSPQAANGGSLDNALKRLDRALDSSSMAQDRISILERLLAYLQAGRLIAAGPPPPPEDAEPMQIEQVKWSSAALTS